MVQAEARLDLVGVALLLLLRDLLQLLELALQEVCTIEGEHRCARFLLPVSR